MRMMAGWWLAAALALGCASGAQRPARATSGSTAQDAAAQDAGSLAVAGPDAGAAPAQVADKQVCVSERTTGSRIARTVCRSQKQAEAEREAAQKALREGERVNRRMGQ